MLPDLLLIVLIILVLGWGLYALRESVIREMRNNRDTVEKLRLDMLDRLTEQNRGNQTQIGESLKLASDQLSRSVDSLVQRVDTQLNQITGKVTERLKEGFKKTNETFVSVMQRLSTIDEAQKKIDGLASNVVSLQSLLGDKRARGAIGEVQLEDIVRNILPPNAYEFQCVLSTGVRVDCLLNLPEPTGSIGVDAKFPLENYKRLIDSEAQPATRDSAERQFRTDVRLHVDAIANKYIIPGETADGAVMFIPAEAIFAEIHGNHPELVEYAMKRRVWIVSPTTLMAILNTAHAVLKNVETRKQVHIIQQELAKLALDFSRFETRMGNLARHIKQASVDVDEVHVSTQKITKRFGQIHRVELDAVASNPLLSETPPSLNDDADIPEDDA